MLVFFILIWPNKEAHTVLTEFMELFGQINREMQKPTSLMQSKGLARV